MSARRTVLVSWLAGWLAVSGCATSPRVMPARDEPALAGWAALEQGKRTDAERIFANRLATDPNDPVALLGTATIRHAQGDGQTAAVAYAATLLVLASPRPGTPPTGWSAALAPVAAGRLFALYDELGPKARAALLERLRPATLARSAGLALPWQARLELARLAEHAARQAADPDAVALRAREAGCADRLFDAGLAGRLANLDLRAEVAASDRLPPSGWRPVTISGCRATLTSLPDGRGGARIVRAAVEVQRGEHHLVLDYPGEALIAVDGSAFAAHGRTGRYGPAVSAVALPLAAGRHQIEVRIASRGGPAQLSLLLFGAGGVGEVAFVDPRPAGAEAKASAAPPPAASPLFVAPTIDPKRPPAGAGALAAYCRAYAADRAGAVDEALGAVDELRRMPRFALGHALAGAVAREDPTRPASFARDGGRRLLAGAVALDPALARAWQALAALELEDDRAREAVAAARSAKVAAPAWWAPDLLLARGLRARGLDFDAASALAEAQRKAGTDLPCPVLEALRREAEERRALGREEELVQSLAGCGGMLETRIERRRARGDLPGATELLRRALRLDPDRDDLAGDLALALAAAGKPAEALAGLRALVARDPKDPLTRIRLADALAATGAKDEAQAALADALQTRPDLEEVRRAARALGVPLPLDRFRLDGRGVIRAFEAAPGRYAGPAVMVLDRSVMRAFSSGALMVLTHQIVRVDSKEAIDRWGEIAVAPGAEILTLRTHKPDGSTREPEDIAGKETISAPELAIGDYVEWETLEAHPPSLAFAPGFLADRFFFQSFEVPLARSEMVLVAPAGLPLEIDGRAGAPKPDRVTAEDGSTVVTFSTTAVPQLFPERAAVPAIEYVPSVRVSSGVDWNGWARYLAQEMHDVLRASPDLDALARELGRRAATDHGRAAAVLDWVTKNVEGTEDLADPAAHTLARGRGSRIALAIALCRALNIEARVVLARSRLLAEGGAPAPPQEIDDFADPLIEVRLGPSRSPLYADLRLRHAALGYLPPGLDGARTLAVPGGQFGYAHSRGAGDRRTVDVTIRIDEQGTGLAMATEELAGWPALEWAELVDRYGADRGRLRQDFEQRWLGVQFPGARLRDLDVELPRDAAGRLGTARVRYSFVSTRLAVAVDSSPNGPREIRIEPTFFRSQPGRRFAAEAQRSTALMLGFDVPVRMTATVELPGNARVDEAALGKEVVVNRGGYRFVEERALRPGRPSVLVLRRESALPIMRVPPEAYPDVAADLRRVDGAEGEAIRIRLGARGGAK